MNAKVNHVYDQNKNISTGAVADEEKDNTKVDRATCLCSRCTIVYSQVQKSRDSGCDEGTGDGNVYGSSSSEVHGEEDKCKLVEQSTSLYKAATRTKAFAFQKGMAAALEMNID